MIYGGGVTKGIGQFFNARIEAGAMQNDKNKLAKAEEVADTYDPEGSVQRKKRMKPKSILSNSQIQNNSTRTNNTAGSTYVANKSLLGA